MAKSKTSKTPPKAAAKKKAPPPAKAKPKTRSTKMASTKQQPDPGETIALAQPAPNAPDNPGAKTPGPPPPYGAVALSTAFTTPLVDENTPRSYPTAVGQDGYPEVQLGTKTADQVKVELTPLPAAQKAELAQHSTGAGPGTGSTLEDKDNPFVQAEKGNQDDGDEDDPDAKKEPE